jgi:hypothetical protein
MEKLLEPKYTIKIIVKKSVLAGVANRSLQPQTLSVGGDPPAASATGTLLRLLPSHRV